MPRIKRIDGIIISVTGYRWNPGTKTIRQELTPIEYLHFLDYMSKLLKSELVKAIESQRYAMVPGSKSVKWPPLTLNYKRYKERVGLSTNIWEATGNLKTHIRIFMRGPWIVVGFGRNDIYSKDTPITYNRVAKYVEYGGVHMPPRPLFRPVVEHLRRNINRYYKKFRKEVLKK
jgi:hypothetical protein